MGWTRTKLLTMNSSRARPTPFAGSRHQRKAAPGAGNVDHHRGARLRNTGEVYFLRLEGKDALVHHALLALGARQRQRVAVVQELGAAPGAHDRRHAELAAHNRRVARGAAVIGNDACGALHDRHPVGIGHLGDENRPVAEASDVLRAADDAGGAGRNRLADRRAREQSLSAGLQPVGFERVGAARRYAPFPGAPAPCRGRRSRRPWPTPCPSRGRSAPPR